MCSSEMQGGPEATPAPRKSIKEIEEEEMSAMVSNHVSVSSEDARDNDIVTHDFRDWRIQPGLLDVTKLIQQLKLAKSSLSFICWVGSR